MRMVFLMGHEKNSTAWMEWRGLVCAFVWFFCSMVCCYEPLFSKTEPVLVFMLLLCAGLAGFAVLFGKRPDLTHKILLFATPVGAVCTGLIPFLPDFAATVLYWMSALLMAPLLCRRLYGVIITARETSRVRIYISAVATTTVLQMVWALLPLDFTVKFPVAAVFALIGLWGVAARLPHHKREELPRLTTLKSPVRLIQIVAIFILLVALNLFNTLIHTHILNSSLENNDVFSLLVWATVPLSFLFFAYFSDYRREKLGFTLGMAMTIVGCFVALMPAGNVLASPLLLAGEFGGTITEFCFLTMPLLFFSYTQRPVLVAVSGLIAHTMLSSVVSWTQDLWLPEALLQEQIDRPLVIFGSVCAMLLIPLVFSLWKQQEDASLMSALLGMKILNANDLSEETEHLESHDLDENTHNDWIQPLALLEREHNIAILLCEGLARSEIAEELDISQAEVSMHLQKIRAKLNEQPPVGHTPIALKAAKQYGLTPRETEVFNELILGRSNSEISANLYIEAATVKTHINKIMKKTGMHNRAELIAQVCTEKKETVSPH